MILLPTPFEYPDNNPELGVVVQVNVVNKTSEEILILMVCPVQMVCPFGRK